MTRYEDAAPPLSFQARVWGWRSVVVGSLACALLFSGCKDEGDEPDEEPPPPAAATKRERSVAKAGVKDPPTKTLPAKKAHPKDEGATCVRTPAKKLTSVPDVAEYCLGFSPTMKSAYVLLRFDRGDNLSVSRSYTVYRVDFAKSRVGTFLDIPTESDSFEGKEENKGDPAAQRADDKLEAALPKLNRAISGEKLLSCSKAKKEKGERWLAMPAERRVMLSTPGRKEPDEPSQPTARLVASEKGKKPRRLLKLEGSDDPREVQEVEGAFYHPCGGGVVVIVGNTEERRLYPFRVE